MEREKQDWEEKYRTLRETRATSMGLDDSQAMYISRCLRGVTRRCLSSLVLFFDRNDPGGSEGPAEEA